MDTVVPAGVVRMATLAGGAPSGGQNKAEEEEGCCSVSAMGYSRKTVILSRQHKF